MKILKAYKYRIYPNKTQKVLLAKTFGCVRYFWNNQVSVFNSYNKETNPTPQYKTSTEIRNEIDWFKEVSAAAIQQKEIDFKQYKNQKFSKTRKGSIGFPSFKKKSNKQSYRLPNQKFKLINNKIQLEKIGKVKIVIDREIPINSNYMSVTISMNCSGQYFVSILVEQEANKLPKTNKTVGLDVGLKEFATLSDGLTIQNPRYFRESQTKLAKIQKYHSRKQKGSNRRKKSRKKIARLHQKISNQRDWFLHVHSTYLVRNYDTICIEDLNVSGMLKNHKLAKSISDVSFSKFFNLLEYKCVWYGKELIKIGRFQPSSKMCSKCGNVKKELKLSDRVYVCDVCGHTEDRDLNASKNIKALGVNNAIRTQSNEVTNCDEAFMVDSNKIL
jgi:putative transposase